MIFKVAVLRYEGGRFGQLIKLNESHFDGKQTIIQLCEAFNEVTASADCLANIA